MAVIEIEGLRKEYRRIRGKNTLAVDGLDLLVPDGGVFGFLGPNGSGKTTTIRCLLGLVRATEGHTKILGVDASRDLSSVMRRIGSMVESPAFFPGFSGRRNLRLLARVDGIPKSRIDEVLEAVGLADRAGELVKGYSLGMKQRLGIGAALLKDPELLILDEPANGLDPAGIKDVRLLVRRLAAEGRTVFVSSHILAEVQHMCDHVAILARGKQIMSGSVSDVLQTGHAKGMIARMSDPVGGAAVLMTAGIEARVEDGAVHARVAPEDAARLTRALATAGHFVTELRPDEADLETVFLELTEDA